MGEKKNTIIKNKKQHIKRGEKIRSSNKNNKQAI